VIRPIRRINGSPGASEHGHGSVTAFNAATITPATDHASGGIIRHRGRGRDLHPLESAKESNHVTSQISPEIAEFKLLDLDAGVGTFAVPGTGYRISLVVPEDFDAPTGRRIRGRVRGHALRMHRTSAGGNFIEPLEGRPRIVQGTVLAIDPATDEVILDLVVPFRIAMAEGQSAKEFATGEMVNFYMHPGASFTPEHDAS